MIDFFKPYFKKIVEAIRDNKNLPWYKMYLLGSRTGGKTYAYKELFSLLPIFDNLKIGMYVIRKNKDKALASYKELEEFSKLNYSYANKQEKHFEFASGKATIDVLNVDLMNDINKTGNSGSLPIYDDLDYLIVCVEEYQQISQEALENALKTLRSSAKTKYMVIHLANPTEIDNEAFKEAMEICMPNLQTLRKVGYQTGERVYKLGDMVRKVFVSWNNYLTAKENGEWIISDDKIFELLEYSKKFPERAVCDVWGFPYCREGLVYPNFKNCIIKPDYKFRFDYFNVGIDIASGRSKKAAKNALGIWGVYRDNEKKCVCKIGEFDIHQNKEIATGTTDKCLRMVKYLMNFKNQYERLNGKIEYKINCYIDSAGVDFFNEFKKCVEELEINFLEPLLRKKREITQRIDLFNNFINTNQLFIWDECRETISEYSHCKWFYTKATNKMVRQLDKDDDINSDEYAIDCELDDMLDKNSLFYKWNLPDTKEYSI